MKITPCLLAWALIDVSNGVSTKMDFGEENTSATNTTNGEDDDVEVKHTIVVSTKLKNNNKKGIRNNDGDSDTLHYNIGAKNSKKEDSGEVPIIYSSKSADSTVIRTPDTRHKAKIYPDSVFITRNIRDQYDNVYPNVAANPMQWQPSTFYNNINYWTADNVNNRRRNNPYNANPKLHRTLTDEGAREFYCKKCAELSGRGYRGCSSSSVLEQRSANPWLHETTTSKIKIDGKLAKLN